MVATGAVWTTKHQMAIEAARGTGLPATMVCSDVIGGFVSLGAEKSQRATVRGTLRPVEDPPITTGLTADMKGIEVKPTFERLPTYLEATIAGGVSAVNSATTVYTRTYKPTATADDLKTLCWEAGLDSRAWQLVNGMVDRFGFEMAAGAPAKQTMDVMFQKATAQAFTGALTPTANEEINGAVFSAWTDSTTIGTTTVKPLDFSIEIQNNWKRKQVGDNTNIPGLFWRDRYGVTATVTYILDATGLAEFDAYLADTLRKLRVKVEGSTIAGSSPGTKKSVTFDLYGYWTDAPISESDGLYVVKSKLQPVYNSTATTDYSIVVANGAVALV